MRLRAFLQKNSVVCRLTNHAEIFRLSSEVNFFILARMAKIRMIDEQGQASPLGGSSLRFLEGVNAGFYRTKKRKSC